MTHYTKAFALTCLTLAASLCSIPTSAHAAKLVTDISQKAKPATLKILIASPAKETILEVKGRYHIYNPENSLPILASTQSSRDLLTISEQGMKWGSHLPPSIFQMRIVPEDSQTTILVNGIQYRGCVEAYLLKGSLHVVNEIDVESYLKSVLTAQFPQPLGDEVMESIAILARTNAYYFIGKNAHSFWHLKAKDVGYLGYGVTMQNLHVDRAVDSTRHMVLTYNGTPFATSWTSNSAGKTADYAAIFRKSIQVPHGITSSIAAKDRAKHHWSFTVTKQHLAKVAGLKTISQVNLYNDPSSGKVYAIKLADHKTSQDIDFFKLQTALGKNRLRSTDFNVDVKGDQVTFSGYGEGHGVGLCLYSAEAMEKAGQPCSKILTHFFPETKLENIRAFPGKVISQQ